MKPKQKGTIYLLCLSRPLCPTRTTKHYLGFSINLERRIEIHRNSEGAKMLIAANERAIDYEVVRTWEGTIDLEYQLKRRKNHWELCPRCKQEYRSKRAKRRADARRRKNRNK